MYGHEGRHGNEQIFIFSFSPSCQSNEIVLMHAWPSHIATAKHVNSNEICHTASYTS